jgi:hypothetical protein
MEAHARLLSQALGIGIEGSKKLLNLFSGLLIRGLFVAQRLALTWLDVMVHLRLHPAHPKYLPGSSEAATL